jgi:hypothetical protein
MLVVDLACTQGHRFEGWFGSAADLSGQQARGLLSCPVCGDAHVQRIPAATRLNVSHLAQEVAAAQAEPSPGVPVAPGAERKPDAVQALQAMYWTAVRHVMQHTEDVGDRFASQARAMHAGEQAAKPIRGQLDAEDREALKEEGIDVMTLVLPKGFDGPVQ